MSKVMTQKDVDAVKPSKDGVRHFGDDCEFGNYCKLGTFCNIGKRNKFGSHCNS